MYCNVHYQTLFLLTISKISFGNISPLPFSFFDFLPSLSFSFVAGSFFSVTSEDFSAAFWVDDSGVETFLRLTESERGERTGDSFGRFLKDIGDF